MSSKLVEERVLVEGARAFLGDPRISPGVLRGDAKCPDTLGFDVERTQVHRTCDHVHEGLGLGITGSWGSLRGVDLPEVVAGHVGEAVVARGELKLHVIDVRIRVVHEEEGHISLARRADIAPDGLEERRNLFDFPDEELLAFGDVSESAVGE